MDTGLGWRTNYQNWLQHFPQDLGVEPTWIVLDEHRPVWTDSIPRLPKRLKGFLHNALQLREGLRKGPFDATFIAAASPQMTLPQYMKKHPCFWYIDATPQQLFDFGDFYGWYPDPNPRREQLKHGRRAVSYRQARGVFGMSQWALDSVVADYGGRPENMHLLPQGVDLTRWHPGVPADKAGKEACDLLFVGSEFARKGGPLLLDWAARTKATNWRLHLVTPQAVETSDPRVCVYNDLTPNDPRLQALYRNADAFVLPTLADCASWAGVEALASGLPLVITATGGTGEIVQNGKTGYVIGLDDPDSLAASLESLIGSPSRRREMGAAARSDAERRFDAPALIRGAVELMMSRV